MMNFMMNLKKKNFNLETYAMNLKASKKFMST